MREFTNRRGWAKSRAGRQIPPDNPRPRAIFAYMENWRDTWPGPRAQPKAFLGGIPAISLRGMGFASRQLATSRKP